MNSSERAKPCSLGGQADCRPSLSLCRLWSLIPPGLTSSISFAAEQNCDDDGHSPYSRLNQDTMRAAFVRRPFSHTKLTLGALRNQERERPLFSRDTQQTHTKTKRERDLSQTLFISATIIKPAQLAYFVIPIILLFHQQWYSCALPVYIRTHSLSAPAARTAPRCSTHPPLWCDDLGRFVFLTRTFDEIKDDSFEHQFIRAEKLVAWENTPQRSLLHGRPYKPEQIHIIFKICVGYDNLFFLYHFRPN